MKKTLDEKIIFEINELNDNEIKNDGFDLHSVRNIKLFISSENHVFLLVGDEGYLHRLSNHIDELSDTRGLVQLTDDEVDFISNVFVVTGISVRYSDHSEGGVFKWACRDFIKQNLSSLGLPVSSDFNDINTKIEKCFFDFTSISMKRV